MDYRNHTHIQFKHFVDVPSSECIIGTAVNKDKKLNIFLIVNGNGPIYKRNGINQSWDELKDDQGSSVRQLVKEALSDRSIPRYSTDGRSILN